MSRRRALSSIGAVLSLSALPLSGFARSRARDAKSAEEFLAAVREGSVDAVREWLAIEPGLASTTDGSGRSAYVLAHLSGVTEVADLLAATGLELDLVESVLAGDWPRFEELAAAHPERLNRAHPVGGTPLYASALVGSRDGWRVRAEGCLPDAAPSGGTGFTPARGALESPFSDWAQVGLRDICANGGDVNAPQRGGDSVLHACVARRDPALVKLAIRKGADVEARDERGRTPRDLAAELKWSEGRALLESHAVLPRDNRASRFALDAHRQPIVRPDLSDVSRKMQSEVTSSSHMRMDQVQAFVESDKRLVFAISSDDELAIEASAHMGNREIMRYYLDHGSPYSLPTAASMGDLEMIRFWLDRDPTLVHERGAHDFPLMWYSVVGGQSIETAEALLGYGASVDQESTGTTALHWCVTRNTLALAEWFLNAGCNPEAVGLFWSRDGHTPLQLAQASGNTKMIDMLKRAGATR